MAATRRRKHAGPASTMRMGELAERSGVPRETIHFYLREGLLPKPRKGGRTVAYYEPAHLERLLLIRRLREEKFLPLAVIRKLLASEAREGDVDTLAEVLHLDPAIGKLREPKPPGPAAYAEALRRRLLDGAKPEQPPDEASGPETRIAALVAEAMQMDEAARWLTLADLEACAAALRDLVDREAEIFFDLAFRVGSAGEAIAALRDGRSVVARFIASFRDYRLYRLVQQLLESVEAAPETIREFAFAELSGEAVAECAGREDWEPKAIQKLSSGRVADRLVAAEGLLAVGRAHRLTGLAPKGSELAALVAWSRYQEERTLPTLEALNEAADRCPKYGLAQVLAAEAVLTRGIRRRDLAGSFVERVVEAMHRVVEAEEWQGDPAAHGLHRLHQARIELLLPDVLGRRERGIAAAREVRECGEPPRGLEAAGVLRARMNAELLMARYWAGQGDRPRSVAAARRALAMDPAGPIRGATAALLRTGATGS